MNCRNLIELSKLIDMNNILLLATIHTYIREKCVGRVSLSKKLKLSERTVRKIIDFLKNTNLLKGLGNICICNEFTDKYQLGIDTVEINEYKLSLVNISDDRLLKYIINHVVELRDYIVIKTQNPRSIEVIGYFNGLEYIIPGLPTSLLNKYRELLNRVSMAENTLFILWRDYTEYYYEAAITSSLYNICMNIESIVY